MMDLEYQTLYYWDDDERSLAPFRFRDISKDEDTYVPIVPIIQKYWKERQEELYTYVAYSHKNKEVNEETSKYNIFTFNLANTYDYDAYYDYSINEEDSDGSIGYGYGYEYDSYDSEEESKNSVQDDISESIIDNMVYKKFSYV